jgi:hypothetical protein
MNVSNNNICFISLNEGKGLMLKKSNKSKTIDKALLALNAGTTLILKAQCRKT